MSNKGLAGGRKIFLRELETHYHWKIEKRFEKKRNKRSIQPNGK